MANPFGIVLPTTPISLLPTGARQGSPSDLTWVGVGDRIACQGERFSSRSAHRGHGSHQRYLLGPRWAEGSPRVARLRGTRDQAGGPGRKDPSWRAIRLPTPTQKPRRRFNATIRGHQNLLNRRLPLQAGRGSRPVAENHRVRFREIIRDQPASTHMRSMRPERQSGSWSEARTARNRRQVLVALTGNRTTALRKVQTVDRCSENLKKSERV